MKIMVVEQEEVEKELTRIFWDVSSSSYSPTCLQHTNRVSKRCKVWNLLVEGNVLDIFKEIYLNFI